MALWRWLSAMCSADLPWARPPQSGFVLGSPPQRAGQETKWRHLASQRLNARMIDLEVGFIGGDFSMAVKGPVAAAFNDLKFMPPGPSPLWGAGGVEEAHADCTAFLCVPKHPFYWHVNKHCCHLSTNEQLGLSERDQAVHLPFFLHLWAINLLGSSRSVMRSDTANHVA